MSSPKKLCQLVSCWGIVIAQFDSAPKYCDETDFVRYDGRVFRKEHEHGGGALSYYEIKCANLAKNDVKGYKPI